MGKVPKSGLNLRLSHAQKNCHSFKKSGHTVNHVFHFIPVVIYVGCIFIEIFAQF